MIKLLLWYEIFESNSIEFKISEFFLLEAESSKLSLGIINYELYSKKSYFFSSLASFI